MRYSNASNKYFKSFDPKHESKQLYLDANNLYGYVMSKLLPASGFRWINPKKFHSKKYTSNISKGSVLEVQLGYLKKERKLHNYYPLARDKIEIRKEILSN